MTPVAGLRPLEPGACIKVARESAVVCIPVYGAHDLFVACVRSVLRHTPVHVPIVVADDASPDPASQAFVEELDAQGQLHHAVWYLRQPENMGFVANVNTVFDAVAPGDVVLLNSDCEVGPEWLERLRAAAYADTTIATASALTNNGTILSVPRRNDPQPDLPSGVTVDWAAVNVARTSLLLRPRIPTGLGHCLYVRRAALDLVGGFDLAFSPGYGEEVDFSQRCVLRGLAHVAADDVFVFHRGKASFAEDGRQTEHEQLIARRYPYYHVVVDRTSKRTTGPLARALAIASHALEERPSVTIDARCLGPTVTGTQVHTLELIHALWRGGATRIRAVVPPDVGRVAQDVLGSLDGVEVLRTDAIDDSTPRTQIVHRPFQVFHVNDLPLLRRLGDRLVITHQDLISFRNPGYARSGLDWLELHRLTRLALAAADLVIFFSQHAAEDAIAEGLVSREHAQVVYLGIDHRAFRPDSSAVRPRALPDDVPEGFLLCLGTDFRHKNRVFALAVLEQLMRRHAWDGCLVLAGPHAASGTSIREEKALLRSDPELARRVVDVGELTDEEKLWLFEHSAAVLYPSLYEGFGLIPFEAAEAGTPCFYAAQTALAETLPPSAASLVPWDAAASADAIAQVLGEPERRRALVAAVEAGGSRLIWDQTAREIADVYEEVIRRPHRELSVAVDGVSEIWDLTTANGELALERLAMPLDVYRGLLAVLARPALRLPFFLFMRVLFMAGYVARHRSLPGRMP